MGISSNGLIGYGMCFEEDFQFPWDETHGGDIDQWWLDVSGFKPTQYPYTPEGKYIEGHTPEISDKYWEEKREFLKTHPLPISIENYCSGEYPIYMICIKESVLRASRGYPTEIFTEDLCKKAELNEWERILREFCEKHLIEVEDTKGPAWYLFSFMG